MEEGEDLEEADFLASDDESSSESSDGSSDDAENSVVDKASKKKRESLERKEAIKLGLYTNSPWSPHKIRKYIR